MKRFLASLAVALLAITSFNASAEGYLREGGKSLVEAGRTADLNYYLTNICSTKNLTDTCTVSVNVAPRNNVGDVYFVSVNDYWVGSKGTGKFHPYKQINEGVDYIDKVKDTSKQKTASGTFYTYEAKNANKFFFIVRRAARKTKFSVKGSSTLAFIWYDEWSYVENTAGGYEELTASWGALKDGSPFPSPHNCDTSLEKNHYISLNEKEDDDAQHHNFTAYLYVPDNIVEKKDSVEYAVPYVFFYNVKLSEGELERKPAISGELECPYNVNLDWKTAFDIFANDSVEKKTEYDTMKEHFIIQRSYDKTNWENLDDAVDVNGNGVRSAEGKITTDTGLKDFDDTTKEIGYTVYYRVISVVQKTDGTQMSTTTSNVVSVNVPGSTPFSLKLGPNGTSQYNPGNMVGGKYVDGSNTFTNTLMPSVLAGGKVHVKKGAEISLVRVDANNANGAVVARFVTTKNMVLPEVVALIGEQTDVFTTPAGEAKDATYQLVLKETSGAVTRSNLATIANAKVSNTAVAVHRSGTPDVATCAAKELFHNEVTFTPAGTGVGTGYYVYCNGEKVAQFVDNGNGTFSHYGENAEIAPVDGKLTVVVNAESAPIAEGENMGNSKTGVEWNYAVVCYDDEGNTYGSAAKATEYSGRLGELVLSVSGSTKVGYSYAQIVSSTALSWTKNTAASDVKAREYEIYRSFDGGAFVKAGTTTGMEYTDSYVYNRKPQTSGNWVNKPTADEYKTICYYIKEIVDIDENEAQNLVEKNSAIVEAKAAQGNIYTGIDDADAESVKVTAANGIITVTGASGAIEVYSANGTLVARANGNGGVTEIDASELAPGAYIVKAANANPTKILIK